MMKEAIISMMSGTALMLPEGKRADTCEYQ